MDSSSNSSVDSRLQEWKTRSELEEMNNSMSETDEFDEDFPSVSRPGSRCALPKSEEDNYNLRRNLRALLEDDECSGGIWLKDLTHTYQMKFGYPLSPREYGFINVMHMVAHFDGPIFRVKQYLKEGDYLLQDVRKLPLIHGEEDGSECQIPCALIQELKKLLKHTEVYTEDLLHEYRKLFEKELSFEKFGFKNLKSFLQHVEITCKDIVLRPIGDRTLMRLNYASADLVDDEPCSYEALPGNMTYDPFPKDVCNADFCLDIDPELTESKEGRIFPINIGEVYSPRKFYIMNLNKMSLLEDLMSELNHFYHVRNEDYRVLPGLISYNSLCVCMYSQNGMWHRVRVVKRRQQTVKVFFIDYGTVQDDVDIVNLRYLHKNFAKHAAFCMQARLSGIQPIGGRKYDISICRQFYLMINNCDLDAEVVGVTPNRLDVNLLVPTDDEGGRTAVQEILISRCFAERKEIEVPDIDERSPDEDATGTSFSKSINKTESMTSNAGELTVTDVHLDEVEVADFEKELCGSEETNDCSRIQNENDTNVEMDTKRTFHEESRRRKDERILTWLKTDKEEDGSKHKRRSPYRDLIARDKLEEVQELKSRNRTSLPSSFDSYLGRIPNFQKLKNVNDSSAEYASYEASYKSPTSYRTTPEHSARTYFASQLPVIPSQPCVPSDHCLQSPTLPGVGCSCAVYNPSYYSPNSCAFQNTSAMVYPNYCVPCVSSSFLPPGFRPPPGLKPPPGLHLLPMWPSNISCTRSLNDCPSASSACQDSTANPIDNVDDEMMNTIASEKMKSLRDEQAVENECFRKTEVTKSHNTVPSPSPSPSSSTIEGHAREYASSNLNIPKSQSIGTDDEKSNSIHTRSTSEAWNKMRSFVNASMSKKL